jgi:hypothetical protein
VEVNGHKIEPGAQLEGADLTYARLESADLSGADLNYADLNYADLTNADLTRANLDRADLTGANLYRANLSFANLSGADLAGANLTGANLWGANLTDANLTGANLTKADLTKADLTRADPTGADFTGAFFDGVISDNLKEIAAKAREKVLRPWYRKKRFMIPLVIVGFAGLSEAFSGTLSEGGSDTKETSGSDITTTTLPKTTTTTEPPLPKTTTTTEPPPSWESLLPLGTKPPAVVAEACDVVSGVVAEFEKTVDERLKVTLKSDAYGDAYAASDFVDEYDWEDVDHDSVLRTEIRGVTDPVLAGALKPQVASEAQFAGFLDSVVEGCDLKPNFEQLIASSQSLDNWLSTVRTRARNLPWYPRDFETWYDDSNLAWRWAERGEFNCSYGNRCQAIFVVSKDGCASGLYAKINILDSSKVVVDYSNDLLSGIRPGDVAKMQFEFFTSGSVSTRLEELSCY